MDPLQPERLPDRAHLVDEGLDRHQRAVVVERGVAAAELVVQDDRTLVRERRQPRLARSRRAGTSVEEEERHASGARVAEYAVPGLVTAERNAALDHCRAHAVTLLPPDGAHAREARGASRPRRC